MKFEMNKMGMDMFDRNVRKMKTHYILTIFISTRKC